MAKTTDQKQALPARGGSYVRNGAKLQQVNHTKRGDQVHSRTPADAPAAAPVAPAQSTPTKE